VHDAEAGGVPLAHRKRGDGDLRVVCHVLAHQFAEVHAVELITAEDEKVLMIALEKVAHVLTHGICGALIPALAIGRLLRGEHLDKTAGELVEAVGAVQVAVQRGAVELGENINLAQAGVDAVADRQVDDPILPRKRNSGLGTILCQRKEPSARAAPHHDR